MTNRFNTDLSRNPADYEPLTPLQFLERAATVFPNHTSILHRDLRISYAHFYCDF
jgi:fatty-acyl-CoA synthase